MAVDVRRVTYPAIPPNSADGKMLQQWPFLKWFPPLEGTVNHLNRATTLRGDKGAEDRSDAPCYRGIDITDLASPQTRPVAPTREVWISRCQDCRTGGSNSFGVPGA